MVFVRQGDQYVGVEKKGFHHSSDSSALTCSVVIFFSPRRSKTGSPSTYLMRGLMRVLRTINSDTALLRVRFRLWAYCAAISAASSSRESVVLIRKVYHYGIKMPVVTMRIICTL